MKLYYSAGSCSTSCHITLEESGLRYEAIGIDWDDESDPNIAKVAELNPMGTLPILVTDDGKVLNQNVSIHTYVAERAPERKLLPAPGTFDRAEAMNWLSFVSSDLHKSFSPLFGIKRITPDPKAQEDLRKWAVGNVNQCLSTMDHGLAGKDYLTGKSFTVADAYAFVVTSWCQWLELPLDAYKNVQAFLERVSRRPAVHKVMKEEGLLDG